MAEIFKHAAIAVPVALAAHFALPVVLPALGVAVAGGGGAHVATNILDFTN